MAPWSDCVDSKTDQLLHCLQMFELMFFVACVDFDSEIIAGCCKVYTFMPDESDYLTLSAVKYDTLHIRRRALKALPLKALHKHGRQNVYSREGVRYCLLSSFSTFNVYWAIWGMKRVINIIQHTMLCKMAKVRKNKRNWSKWPNTRTYVTIVCNIHWSKRPPYLNFLTISMW